MKKIILSICGAIVVLIGIGMFLANRDAANRYYFLSIVNNSNAEANVSVSLTDQIFNVPAHQSQTFKVEGQNDKDSKTERTITIKADNINDSIQTAITYSSTLVVDVTGTSCIVAADYGPQYRGPDVKLPENQSDIVVSKVIRDQRSFKAPTFKAADGDYEVSARTVLGEKLPDKIEARNGVMPTHGRLISVPCEILNSDADLYDFLNAN